MLFRLLKKIMDPVKNFIHQINADSHKLNKSIVQTSNTMKHIPMDKTIYQQQPPRQGPQQAPAQAPPQAQPPQLHPMPDGSNPAAAMQQPAPQVGIDTEKLEQFVDRLTSVEKKIDRFFNLIEKRVVKNAKEVTIRIKLNEDKKVSENSNSEQE